MFFVMRILAFLFNGDSNRDSFIQQLTVIIAVVTYMGCFFYMNLWQLNDIGD